VDSLPVTALTSREEEVARLAAQNLSNQVIAHRLFLSVRTVEAHLSHVYTKLGATGRAELAALLAESGTASTAPPPSAASERLRSHPQAAGAYDRRPVAGIPGRPSG
jgi:DNA-binding CsgD family transcriptional regulator